MDPRLIGMELRALHWQLAAPSTKRLQLCAFALVVVLALALGRDHPLQNLNEGLRARVAQEMLERREFIVPTPDRVPYLEKPPLLYWMAAASLAAFGSSENAVRLAPLLGAVLMLAAAAWFARRDLAVQTGRFALAMLVSSPIDIVLSRSLMFDMLSTGLLFASLVTSYEALAGSGERLWLRWSYDFLALAILAKGLVALLIYALAAAVLLLSMRKGSRAATSRRLFEPVARRRSPGARLVTAPLPDGDGGCLDCCPHRGRVDRSIAHGTLRCAGERAWDARRCCGPRFARVGSVAARMAGRRTALLRRGVDSLRGALFGLLQGERGRQIGALARHATAWSHRSRLSVPGIRCAFCVSFLSRSPVGVVDSRSGDLWYGVKRQPGLERFPNVVAMQRRAAEAPLWLAVSDRESRRFAASGLAAMFTAKRSFGPNTLYASRPLAERQNALATASAAQLNTAASSNESVLAQKIFVTTACRKLFGVLSVIVSRHSLRHASKGILCAFSS